MRTSSRNLVTGRVGQLIINHDDSDDTILFDIWEFMGEKGMILQEVEEPATARLPARTVVYHRLWTPEDHYDFDKLYYPGRRRRPSAITEGLT